MALMAAIGTHSFHETKKSQIIRPEHQNHRITCTKHKGSSTLTATRPRSDLRPRATKESVFNGGDIVGYSPDPMTLLSSLFGDVDEYKSFSEFLVGAMMDPTPPRYKMNRGKAAAIEFSGPTREFMKWTEDMDARLLHSMIEESRIALSRPTAAKWRVNSMKHYNLMVELWAADRAIGSGVRTASQARRQRVGPRVSVDLNQNIEYIPEQPEWTGYRDPTPPSPPPSVDEYSPEQTQSVPSVPSGGTSSSRGSKGKAPMVDVIDSQFDKLTTSLDGFANVLSSSNVHFGLISNAIVRQVSAMEDRNQIIRSQTEILRRTPNYTYTEADIYEMLSAMNIADENLIEQCYDFLCGNPTCTKRLMGLPPHKRWNKLCKMISGGDC
ncbi:WRKY transcription factor 4 WRKY DNA-binding protein [Vigna angularis]|uniref:WRKY transcription factor 4 WRKY DNA-binding protein n=1 Tax=Phaseolus angularis TaxID=3914 RepID=A0A8T0JU10_PHAAN|nr:WRKY transcription factor 4 WRKY DNA-binding protein [Vigna angularis]